MNKQAIYVSILRKIANSKFNEKQSAGFGVFDKVLPLFRSIGTRLRNFPINQTLNNVGKRAISTFKDLGEAYSRPINNIITAPRLDFEPDFIYKNRRKLFNAAAIASLCTGGIWGATMPELNPINSIYETKRSKDLDQKIKDVRLRRADELLPELSRYKNMANYNIGKMQFD